MKHGKYHTDSTNMRVFTNHAQFDSDLPKNSKKKENTKMLAKLSNFFDISNNYPLYRTIIVAFQQNSVVAKYFKFYSHSAPSLEVIKVGHF